VIVFESDRVSLATSQHEIGVTVPIDVVCSESHLADADMPPRRFRAGRPQAIDPLPPDDFSVQPGAASLSSKKSIDFPSSRRTWGASLASTSHSR
jgi:hypothetical protein